MNALFFSPVLIFVLYRCTPETSNYPHSQDTYDKLSTKSHEIIRIYHQRFTDCRNSHSGGDPEIRRKSEIGGYYGHVTCGIVAILLVSVLCTLLYTIATALYFEFKKVGRNTDQTSSQSVYHVTKCIWMHKLFINLPLDYTLRCSETTLLEKMGMPEIESWIASTSSVSGDLDDFRDGSARPEWRRARVLSDWDTALEIAQRQLLTSSTKVRIQFLREELLVLAQHGGKLCLVSHLCS